MAVTGKEIIAPVELKRGIGPLQATALNVTMIVGAGVFVTIPTMLGLLPGPYALLAWIVAGLLILFDGMIWSELGAALPSSGGSYRYLLISYGKERWGRLMAFLFIWQFMISGPLELGSGLIAIAQFSTSLSPAFQKLNSDHSIRWVIWKSQDVAISLGPSRVLAFAFGLLIIFLLYRNITSLGKLTITFWLGVMGAIAWILFEGFIRFNPAIAFSFTGAADHIPTGLAGKVGLAMILSIYSYLGYYNVCYIGDEVRDPGRTIPKSIFASVLIVTVLFTLVHLAMLGTVPWQQVPTNDPNFTLPAEFMRRIHGPWAASAITVLLVWCCFGSVFAGMLGYSRIPYGASRNGHFFPAFAKVHSVKEVPHLSLLLIGALTLLWGFFDLQTIINALITTRILEQFVCQIIGVFLLRKNQPDLERPYRIWLYPLPCFIALAGWLYIYFASGWLFIGLGAGTMLVGAVVFLYWSLRTGRWPFDRPIHNA
jgi:APA family basic amino acid/polyamine antiporter